MTAIKRILTYLDNFNVLQLFHNRIYSLSSITFPNYLDFICRYNPYPISGTSCIAHIIFSSFLLSYKYILLA